VTLLKGDRFLPPYFYLKTAWNFPQEVNSGLALQYHIRNFKAVLCKRFSLRTSHRQEDHTSASNSFQSQAVVEKPFFPVIGKICIMHVAVDSWRLILNSSIPNS
jgi:hypothetical protein